MIGDRTRQVLGGKYELLSIAGKGGMAVVWRARIVGQSPVKFVAVKRMLLDASREPAIVAMFIEEARVGKQLRHPNIVRLIDFSADETNGYYLVLEWIDGLDLLDYMRSYHEARVHMPWQPVAAIAQQSLRGLVAAHERRDEYGRLRPVIHRDLSPSNILVGFDGMAKIADFGLARAADRATMTMPSIIKGKLSYTAPEVAKGQKASERSDLFSLGVTLWECLAARKLFTGKSSLDVIRSIMAWKIPDLRTIRPDVPTGLASLILRALARNVEDRFANAREMHEALSLVLEALPEPITPTRLGLSVKHARSRLDSLDAQIPVILESAKSDPLEISVDIEVDFSSSPSAARGRTTDPPNTANVQVPSVRAPQPLRKAKKDD
jgi:serine/threonine-protein kinase